MKFLATVALLVMHAALAAARPSFVQHQVTRSDVLSVLPVHIRDGSVKESIDLIIPSTTDEDEPSGVIRAVPTKATDFRWRFCDNWPETSTVNETSPLKKDCQAARDSIPNESGYWDVPGYQGITLVSAGSCFLSVAHYNAPQQVDPFRNHTTRIGKGDAYDWLGSILQDRNCAMFNGTERCGASAAPICADADNYLARVMTSHYNVDSVDPYGGKKYGGARRV